MGPNKLKPAIAVEYVENQVDDIQFHGYSSKRFARGKPATEAEADRFNPGAEMTKESQEFSISAETAKKQKILMMEDTYVNPDDLFLAQTPEGTHQTSQYGSNPRKAVSPKIQVQVLKHQKPKVVAPESKINEDAERPLLKKGATPALPTT